MSDLISRIHDDMERYEVLCHRFGETPHYSSDSNGNLLLDCYGAHAKDLEARAALEENR